MSSKLTLVLLTVSACIILSSGEDLQVGTSVNSVLAYVENVKLSAIPLKQRTKNVFYSDEKNQLIKGISAVDLAKSKTTAIVTSGGVGFPHVNLRIKSDRGDGINYQVQIFV